MRVRPATPADVPALATLEGTPREDLARRRVLEARAAGAHGWCLVAETGQGVVGTALVRAAHLLGHDEVSDLLVAPSARRTGAGRALLAAASGAAGTDCVLAAVPVRAVPARALFASCGWSARGRLRGVAGGDVVVVGTTPGPAPEPGRLYHLALREDWDRALRDGAYRTSTIGRSLAEEGLVHTAFAHQVPLVADGFYTGLDAPLVLLTLDRARLSSRVVVEAVPGVDEVFPHVYGPIDLAAVSEVTRLVHDPTGRLAFPWE